MVFQNSTTVEISLFSQNFDQVRFLISAMEFLTKICIPWLFTLGQDKLFSSQLQHLGENLSTSSVEEEELKVCQHSKGIYGQNPVQFSSNSHFDP